MSDPWTLTGPGSVIAMPDKVWEKQGGRQILEGPEFLRGPKGDLFLRSEEHTSELQSLMRISYAVFCLKKKKRFCMTIPAISVYNRYINKHSEINCQNTVRTTI